MKKTFAIKILSGNTLHEYSANIEREELMGLIEKHTRWEIVNIPLGSGTAYLEWNEYQDNAVLTVLPYNSNIAVVIEHNLEEKKPNVSLKTK